MYEMFYIIKANFKLLLRNKGFLFFLLALPLLSILILNIKDDESSSAVKDGKLEVIKLKSADQKIIYYADYSKVSVKVFDSSKGEISDYIFNDISNYGMFTIYKYNDESMSLNEAKSIANEIKDSDIVSLFVYISNDFDKEMLEGKVNNSLTVLDTGSDERNKMFEDVLKKEIAYSSSLVKNSASIDDAVSLLKENRDKKLSTTVTTIKDADSSELSPKQSAQIETFSYSIAVVTLAFIFCGLMIASLIIKEKQNNVVKRVIITNVSTWKYLSAKFILSILTIIIQTAIIGIGIKLFVTADYGVSMWTYMFVAAGLGVIFSFFSLFLGLVCNNVMNSYYIGFIAWSVSSLLGGMYFTIENSSKWYQNFALLMPQRWGKWCAQMAINGNNYAYGIYVGVICSFVIVLMAFSLVSTKVMKSMGDY